MPGFFHAHWTWLGILVMAAAAALLAALIVSLVRTVRRAHLFRAPLAGSQEVRFAEAGPVALSVEAPRFSGRFRGIGFELRSADGAPVPGRRVFLRTGLSGWSRARIELLRFDIPRPGAYRLNMSGVAPAGEGGACPVVFSRPCRGPLVAHIVGIVLAGQIFIASLVLWILNLAGPPEARP